MTTAKLPLPPKLLPVFSGTARYRGAYGGRGSAKTRSFALMAAVDGYRFGRSGVGGVIMCAREHLNSLEESSLEEVKQAIMSVPWLASYYEMGEKFVRSRDGRVKFIFSGLRHNINAVKSKARILRAWVDEAEHVSETAWRLLIPTVRDEGDWWNSEIWVTWNPESPESATNLRFRKNPPPNSKIIQLNYTDNPWFPETLEQERLYDYETRPDTYSHIWEGDYLVISDAQIFKDKFTLAEFEPAPSWDGPYHGLDFGFSQDPTAAIRCYINDNKIYIRYELCRTKLELDKTAQAVADAIPQASFFTIRADNARPESISYLQRHGLPRITGVDKWKGSVEDGIEFIKSFEKVIIHPDCPETYRQFQLYSYKVDRLSGDVLPTPLDQDNHIPDALRYALAPMIRGRKAPKIRVL